MHQEIHKNTGRASTSSQDKQYEEIKALQERAADDAESLEKALKSMNEAKSAEMDAKEEKEKAPEEEKDKEKDEQQPAPVKE